MAEIEDKPLSQTLWSPSSITIPVNPPVGKIALALSKAQKDFPDIHKDKKANVGKFGYTYASLPSIVSLVTPILSKHELVVTQLFAIGADGRQELETWLMHSSGEKLVSRTKLPVDTTGSKNVVQQAGSAITYFRRYALCAILGIAPDDDDDGAGVRAPQKVFKPTSQPSQPAPGGASEAQQKAIWAIRKAKKIPDDRFRSLIQIASDGGTSSTRELSKGQASTLIEALNNYSEKPPVNPPKDFAEDDTVPF